jgi:hypothetical protein
MLSLISSSYREQKVKMSNKIMLQLESNQKLLTSQIKALKEANIDTIDSSVNYLSHINVDALNNEFPDFLKDMNIDHLFDTTQEIEDKAHEYNKKQDEDLAKFNQYLRNNPGALAGLLALIASKTLLHNNNEPSLKKDNEEDFSQDQTTNSPITSSGDLAQPVLENQQQPVPEYSKQKVIQKLSNQSSQKKEDLAFINEFVFSFLSPYISGKITAASDPQDRLPMIFQLFEAIEKNNSQPLSDPEKKQIEELAFKSYLKTGMHGLYNRLKLDRYTEKSDSPQASEAYKKLFLALEPAIKKDFPDLKINNKELEDAIKKTGLAYDIESDNIKENMQQILKDYPPSGDPADRKVKDNRLSQQLAKNQNNLFLDPDYSVIQEKKKQFDQVLENAYLDPNLTKEDLVNLEKEQEKEIQMMIKEQQQKTKAVEEARKNEMRQQLKDI